MFLSNARVHHNGGSFLIRKPTAFTITTHHRKKPYGTSRKIVISYHWPNCKSLSKRQSRHRESLPSLKSRITTLKSQVFPVRHIITTAATTASSDMRKTTIERTAHGEITIMRRTYATSHVTDQLVRYIPRATPACLPPIPYMRNSTRSTITLSSVSHTSSVSMAAKARRVETITNIWILASQATRRCPATIIEKCRRVAVCELEVHTQSQAISITPIITLECFKRAPAHTTFRIEANIWCHPSLTHRIWRRATINHLRTIQERHWWRNGFSMRVKILDDRATAQQSHRRSIRASITVHRRSTLPVRVALCRLSAAQRVAHTYSSGRIRSMATIVMIRCTKSTSSRWRIRLCRDEGIRLRRKIDWNRVIRVRSRPSVPSIR